MASAKIGEIDESKLDDFKHALTPTPATLLSVLGVVRLTGKADVEIADTGFRATRFSAADIADQKIKTVTSSSLATGLITTLIQRLDVTVQALGLGIGLGGIVQALGVLLTPLGPGAGRRDQPGAGHAGPAPRSGGCPRPRPDLPERARDAARSRRMSLRPVGNRSIQRRMTDPTPAADMTYARYLDLDRLLAAQSPISDEHDEMLFVIIHQTKELWLKQILHEVALAQSLVRAGDLVPAYKSLARVSRIQAVMTQSWDILATMTPADYLRFRGVLGSSSGFQSDQFRRFETMLGLKDAKLPVASSSTGPRPTRPWPRRIAAPSLYDDALAQLAKAGLPVPAEVLNRDVSQPYQPSEGGRGRLAGGLSRHRALVALLPTGRETGRSGRRPADLAAQACGDGRADHRPSSRHGRHRRRRLSVLDAASVAASPSCGRCERSCDAESELDYAEDRPLRPELTPVSASREFA